MGPDWHFEGRRRLVWMHDRVKPNGYIEFGAEGVLRTSLCPGGRGTWELRATGEMVLTFGKCYHLVFLLDAVQGQPPLFELQERVMKDGSPPRGRRTGPATRGGLDMQSSCVSLGCGRRA